jgi:hypothetical protein
VKKVAERPTRPASGGHATTARGMTRGEDMTRINFPDGPAIALLPAAKPAAACLEVR